MSPELKKAVIKIVPDYFSWNQKEKWGQVYGKMGSSLLLTHDRKKNIQHRNLHNTKRLQGLKDMTEKLINRYGRYRGC